MYKDYWENYYKDNGAPLEPSLFAHFVLNNYIKEPELSSLIEFGCGNGRDSLFFASKGIIITAIDQCGEQTETLRHNQKHPNISFFTEDFTNITEVYKTFDYVYSRFTLHSVSDSGETNAIREAYNHLVPHGMFSIETRGKKNELYKLGNPVPHETDAFIRDNHYRRFSDIANLIKKIENAGFTIIYSEEARGFAPFGDTDYTFIRIIAQK